MNELERIALLNVIAAIDKIAAEIGASLGGSSVLQHELEELMGEAYKALGIDEEKLSAP